MKIAFFNTKIYEQEYFDRYNQHYDITYLSVPLNESTASLAEGHAVICAFVNDQINAAVIEKLTRVGVRLIAMRCAGYNNVDVPSAAKAGIKIVRVPEYSPHAVAEHAMALVLTLNRKTHKAYNRVREGNFSLEKLTGFDLYNKTVGVVGTGKIGAVFCRIAKGFGCRVIAYDVRRDEQLASEGIGYVTADELLRQSDIVSLHCPLTSETHHLLNATSIKLMKPGAMLINTSRGGLVETEAVIEALKRGQLGYLGLDVYEQEANVFFQDLSDTVINDDILMRLMTFPNVLITSHQGFFTKEALTEIALTTLQNISQFIEGTALKNEVR